MFPCARLCVVLLLTGILGFGSGKLYGQKEYDFQDDPVAAMLDSLIRLNIFEKKTKPVASTSKFKYAPDSIPRFTSQVIAQRLSKMDAASPFDLHYNEQVQAYIDMYSVRKRALMSKVLGLSEIYFPVFEQALDKHNLPLELKYLAVIESALNPRARSRVGATGLWQFMYPTGKMYGLKVTSYLDERSDPLKATEAACQYLQFLYETFGDWQMAIAAYNCGPGNINKAIRRSGGKKTYWEIRPYLPKETQGYVPSFIAVAYVMNFAAEHNLQVAVVKNSFQITDTVHIKQEISLAQVAAVLGVPQEDLEFLNPCYKRGIIPYDQEHPHALTLPSGLVGSFVTNEKAIYTAVKVDQELNSLITKEVARVHYVKSGEKINTVANKYKCTTADIMAWNNLKSYKIYPGQKLTVYVSVKQPEQSSSASNQTNTQKPGPEKNSLASGPTKQNETNSGASSSGGKFIYHTIQKGDTLWILSQKYGISVAELKRINAFGEKYMLHPGQKVKVGVEKG